MRKLVPWALAVALLLGFGHLCLAEKPKPVVTVSFSGYDELMKDIDLIGKLGNFPQLGKMLEAGVQQQEAPRMLLSLIDKTKPWGAVVSMAADSPQPVVQVAIPVTDIKPILKAMQDHGVQPRDIGGGAYEIQAGPQSVVFKQKGSWTIAASTKEALDEIPGDPAALLGGLSEKYTLAASVAVKNIPDQVREQAMFPLRFFVQMAAQQPLPGEASAQTEMRGKMFEQALNRITEVIKDLDTVLLGLAIDRKTNSARLDLVTTLLPGSKTAQKLAKIGDVKTDLAGLADPNAALLLTVTRKLDEEEISLAKGNIAALRSNFLAEIDKNVPPTELKLVKQVAGDLMDVWQKTIEGGKIDGGLMLNLAPKNVQLVAGAKIADGAKLNQALKLILERAAKEVPPQWAQMMKLDAETYQGVRFHVISLPVAQIPDPTGQGLFSKLFTDKVDLILGVGDESAYVALGSDAAKTLKGVIDKSKSASGSTTPPLQVAIALTPIARFVADIGDRNAKQGADMILKIVSAGSGPDHIKLTVTMIPNGSQARLELEEGVVRVLSAIPMLRMQAAPPSP